jgi:hypothetical protein
MAQSPFLPGRQRDMIGVYLLLAAVPVVLWLCMELDARRHSARELARRKR